jgi:hypothetical protein
VAPAQPEGNVSSVAGRAWMPGPRVAWLELRTSRPCMAWAESWVSRGAWSKSVKKVMMVLRRVTRSDYLGWWSDCQPLFCGGFDRLGKRSDRQICFRAGKTASLYSRDGLTAWWHGQTASLYSRGGQTSSTCGLTASSGQRREPWGNVRCRQW